MRSRQLLYAALLISFLLSQPASAQNADPARRYAVQVVAFPETEKQSADRFIDELARAGELPTWETIELPGRGKWIRIFIGSFATFSEARRYGASLQSRALIKEFLVRASGEIAELTRPRRVTLERRYGLKYDSRPIIRSGPARVAYADEGAGAEGLPVSVRPRAVADPSAFEGEPLPVIEEAELRIELPGDDPFILRADPVESAFKAIAGEGTATGRGGVWVTGDMAEALARLEWVVGIERADLLGLDADGRLQLNMAALAELAGINEVGPSSAPLVMLDYILSNEGLLLLVQLTCSPHRYRLHMGREAPTLGGLVTVGGGMNLDNNFDSRINPYRRFGAKLDQERPPEGFDSLIAINPIARWYNLQASRLVPDGHIIFHELAEAYAKLELGLDYLSQGARAGAHNTALQRERRLKAQRPASVVVTAGPNRVLRSEEEIRQFYAEGNGGSGHQR